MSKKKENLSLEERLQKAIIPKEEEPYKIPDNWIWTRMENISEKITDGTHKTPTYTNQGIPFISVKDIRNGEIFFNNVKYISLEEHKELYKRCNPEKGDVLVTKSGTIGRTAIVKNDFEFSLFVSVALIKNRKNIINSNFLSYVIQDFINKIDVSKDIKGGVIKNYHISDIKKQLVPLPPIEEQKRIVEKLDSLFEKTQKIKDIIEEVKEKTISRREAILSKAFTGELTEKWRSENKTSSAEELLYKINDEKIRAWQEECEKAEEEGKKKPSKPQIKDISEMLVKEDEIPYKVPNYWVWTRLSEITSILNGDRGKNYPAKNKLFKEGEIPFISAANIENGKILRENLLFLSEEQYGKLKAGKLKENDLLFCIRGSLGKYGKNHFLKGAIASSLVIVRSNLINQDSIEYIGNYFKTSLLKKEILKYDNGTAQPNLSAENFKKFILPLPPLEEQKEIVRILDKVFEEENKISELLLLEEKVEVLEKTILDKAFRGELGTGNIEDEPVIEMLKNILETK